MVRRRENRRTAFREWKPPEKKKESLDWKTKKRKNKENNEVGEVVRGRNIKEERMCIHRTNAKYKWNGEK